jgi:hypothetical protein
MFSYSAYKRYEKARKGKRLYQQYSEKKKILFMFKVNGILNCWRFENPYEKLHGLHLHQQWASGEGPIVRHLCSDGRCINPLHLVRGTDYENAKDEIEVRNFENELMMQILNDYSLKGEDKTLIHYTLLPKVSIKMAEEVGPKSLGEVNKILREQYRQAYVKRVIDYENSFSVEALDNAQRKLSWLQEHQEITIINIPGI